MKQKQPAPKKQSYSWRHEKTIFWIVFIILCLIHCSNIIRLDVYPFTDLPNHLAEATIYKYINEPGTEFSNYYQSQVDIFKPNTLHILFCSLFGNIELGNKIFYMPNVKEAYSSNADPKTIVVNVQRGSKIQCI